MNVLRLKESNCAKIMHKLEKCSDESISKCAKTVVEKWRAVIDSQTRATGNKLSQNAGKSETNKSGKQQASSSSSAVASDSHAPGTALEPTTKKSKVKNEEVSRKRKRNDSTSTSDTILSIDSSSDSKIKFKKIPRALVGGVHVDKKSDKVKQVNLAANPGAAAAATTTTAAAAAQTTLPIPSSLFRSTTTKIKYTKSRMDFLAEDAAKAASKTTETGSSLNKRSKLSENKSSSSDVYLRVKPLSSLPKIPKVNSEDRTETAFSAAALLPPPVKPVIKV